MKKPKRTRKQREASRENGKKSQGATSAEGRAKIKWNAFQYGLDPRYFSLPPWENMDIFLRQLHFNLLEHQPDGFAEIRRIIRLTQNDWRLDRAFLGETEARLIAKDQMDLLKRQEYFDKARTRLTNQMGKDMAEFRRLRDERLAGLRHPLADEDMSEAIPQELQAFIRATGFWPGQPGKTDCQDPDLDRYADHIEDLALSMQPPRHSNTGNAPSPQPSPVSDSVIASEAWQSPSLDTGNPEGDSHGPDGPRNDWADGSGVQGTQPLEENKLREGCQGGVPEMRQHFGARRGNGPDTSQPGLNAADRYDPELLDYIAYQHPETGGWFTIWDNPATAPPTMERDGEVYYRMDAGARAMDHPRLKKPEDSPIPESSPVSDSVIASEAWQSPSLDTGNPEGDSHGPDGPRNDWADGSGVQGAQPFEKNQSREGCGEGSPKCDSILGQGEGTDPQAQTNTLGEGVETVPNQPKTDFENVAETQAPSAFQRSLGSFSNFLKSTLGQPDTAGQPEGNGASQSVETEGFG